MKLFKCYKTIQDANFSQNYNLCLNTYWRMYSFIFFLSTLSSIQNVWPGKILFQLRKSFSKDTTLGFVSKRFQLSATKEIKHNKSITMTNNQRNLKEQFQNNTKVFQFSKKISTYHSVKVMSCTKYLNPWIEVSLKNNFK